MFGNNAGNTAAGYPPQPSAYPSRPDQQIDSPYLQELRQRLADVQKLQAELRNGNVHPFPPMGSQPMPPNPGPPPDMTQYAQPAQNAPQSSGLQLSREQQLILQMFDEFAQTDDGKQLVSFIGKFSNFCQSKIEGPKETQ